MIKPHLWTGSSVDSDKNIQYPNHHLPLQRQPASSIPRSGTSTGRRKQLRHQDARDPHLRRRGPATRSGCVSPPGPSGRDRRSRPDPGWGRGRTGQLPAPLRSPVRAPSLQQGPGRGHRPVAEAENGAEKPNQPFVHTKPKQQRRPTHPETQTPELSPPLPPSPPSPPQPPQPRFSRRLVTRSAGPQIERPQG